MTTKFTPENITELAPNEIFVFGSNSEGQHAGGAAYFAMDRFGAKWGIGEGLVGNTYALPTMDDLSNPESIKPHADKFIEFAKAHPEYTFLVTKVGCGIAGFTIEEVAPYFKGALALANVVLPKEFVDSLNTK